MADRTHASNVFADGSISLRLYPHNELAAVDIVDQLCAQAAIATDNSFDGVMTSEHHGGFAGYLPNPLQTSSFQLSAMSRGWAAACPVLLPLRPVAMLAEEVAWLDARFPGRVGIGVGSGSLPLDFEAMDIDQSTAVDVFKRDLPRLVSMLAGRDLGVIDGDRALRELTDRSIPVISTAMSSAAVRRAANAGAGIIFDGGSNPDRLRTLSDAYVEAGGQAPRILIRRVWLGLRCTRATRRRKHFRIGATTVGYVVMMLPRWLPNSLKRCEQRTPRASTCGSMPPALLPTRHASKSLRLDPRCSPAYETFSQTVDNLGLDVFKVLTHESAVKVGVQTIGA